MDFEPVSQKELNNIEYHVRELLAAMRKAKLQNSPLGQSLRAFEQELGKVRRERFDAVNSEYNGY
ncbi:MAG: hypothetical protein D6737_06100 [Chloroflexi bacterium]|nr:MAG: hypothetical protein D6737_06100 [Chloroflexota bacterium]